MGKKKKKLWAHTHCYSLLTSRWLKQQSFAAKCLALTTISLKVREIGCTIESTCTNKLFFWIKFFWIKWSYFNTTIITITFHHSNCIQSDSCAATGRGQELRKDEELSEIYEEALVQLEKGLEINLRLGVPWMCGVPWHLICSWPWKKNYNVTVGSLDSEVQMWLSIYVVFHTTTPMGARPRGFAVGRAALVAASVSLSSLGEPPTLADPDSQAFKQAIQKVTDEEVDWFWGVEFQL